MRKTFFSHIFYVAWRYVSVGAFMVAACCSVVFVCVRMDFSLRSYEIVGIGNGNYSEQHTYMNGLLGSNIFAVKRSSLEAIFRRNGWVGNVHVRRKIPDQLLIHVHERVPVAIWKNGEQLCLIDAKNNIIRTDNIKKFAHLPIISGELSHFGEIWRELEQYPTLVQKMLYIERVHNRRWNICVSPHVIIKLPENGFEKALQVLCDGGYGIVRDDVSVIDCRVPGKVVVRKK